MQELIKNIENWAEERNLINGSTPQKQFIKLMEEFGELCAGISRDNIDMIKDGIGDCFVVMVILNKQVGKPSRGMEFFSFGNPDMSDFTIDEIVSDLADYAANGYERPFPIVLGLSNIADVYQLNFEDCISQAYNEIKDRKGKMINGVFVKDADLGAKND